MQLPDSGWSLQNNDPRLQPFLLQIPAGLSDDPHQYSNNIAASLPRTHDENSKLGQILEDFSQEIIDISVVDHQGDTLLQTEINEKMTFYTGKLEGAGGRIVRDHRQELAGEARLNRAEMR